MNTTGNDEVHQLAPDADGRWVGGLIIAVVGFWTTVGWLIWRAFR